MKKSWKLSGDSTKFSHIYYSSYAHTIHIPKVSTCCKLQLNHQLKHFAQPPLPVKGTVQGDFRPPVFFSSLEPAWAPQQWVKIFSIFVKISRYSSFFIEKTDYAQYHFAQSKKIFILGLLSKNKMYGRPFVVE